MAGDEVGLPDEGLEGRRKRGVALLDGREETVVGRRALRGFPHAFDAVELRRVWRQAMELYPMAVLAEPPLALIIETVARPVVEDQEDLATASTHKPFEEAQERRRLEDRCELVGEPWSFLDRDSSEDVSRFAHAEGIDTRLVPDWRPRPVKTAVEPEARLVLERYDTAAAGRFFLIRGNVLRNQTA